MNWEMFDEDEVFTFLDDLRDLGVINMFGATSFLMDEFNMEKYEARLWLSEWMSSFDQRNDHEAKEEL